MLGKIINNMKNNRILFDEEYNINDLLDVIKEHLNNNVDILEKSFEHEYNTSLDINRLLKAFDLNKDNKRGIIDSTFKNEFGMVANNYVPYGVVGVVVHNDISLYNYASIISLLIQTNNSIILEPYRDMGTVNILVEMINQVITQVKGINSIVVCREDLKSAISLDLLLFIGDKKEFYTINNEVPKKYYGIGNYELIVDKPTDKQLIEEAKKKNVKIIDKEDDDFFYSNFNLDNSNYCTSIMSSNREEIKKFMANVRSSNILVNAIPTLVDDINIDINDLLYKKSTLVWEK